MNARDAILSSIRAAAVPPSAAAALVVPTGSTSDPLEQFLQALASVGGRGIVRRADQTIASVVADFAGVDRADMVVVPGRFAVAENGAVYVDAADLDARADIVRAEHLVLVVPAAALVPTMHEAVRLVPSGSACGWFLSGPSKTADIEQSLVVGAQGARTLHVIFDAG